MKWTPLGDQIIVRPLLPPDQTTGGIYLPEEGRERPQRGVVLAVGPGLPSELTGNRAQPQTTAGDLVLFGQHAGVQEQMDGESVLLMRDAEALAKKSPGDYAVVEHVDARGITKYHLDGERCELCPKVSLEAERERLKLERGH